MCSTLVIIISLQYVCFNNMHVAVCPLIVMNPSLHEFPVVSPMSSVMAMYSLVHGQTPTVLY